MLLQKTERFHSKMGHFPIRLWNCRVAAATQLLECAHDQLTNIILRVDPLFAGRRHRYTPWDAQIICCGTSGTSVSFVRSCLQ